MISGSLAGEYHAIYLSILHAEWIFIVSSSKDAVIRVWNRATLSLHCTLRGHEGPVNAIGLQASRVVSASGDGKMILWDINSGERLRTFEGHDRGLACIEFKVGYRFLRLIEIYSNQTLLYRTTLSFQARTIAT
jgi:WD40 repeat protein